MRHPVRADAGELAMNFRWLWLDYIPSELGLTAAQRRQVRRRARLHHAPQRISIAMLGLAVAISSAVIFNFTTAKIIGRAFVPPLSHVLEILVSVATGVLFWIVAAGSQRHTGHRAVREALLDMGYRLCRHCGYWLRSCDQAATCPECGETNFDRARKLNIRDLGEPEIVTTMQQLGYHVCFNCGLLVMEVSGDAPMCPDCGSEMRKSQT
jgi:predicted RNA-binding Zn-ribbon protein involved in translation (DUF1610 family)